MAELGLGQRTPRQTSRDVGPSDWMPMHYQGDERIYRNRADQALVLTITVAGQVWLGWQFALPSVGGPGVSLAIAFGVAVLGWFGYRVSVRCRVSITPTQIQIVNPIRTFTFPPSAFAGVDVDVISLIFVLSNGRRIHAWGVPSSAFNNLERVRNSIKANISALGEDGAPLAGQDSPIRSTVSADFWILILLFTIFAAEILIRHYVL
jgi:hypothetical protein